MERLYDEFSMSLAASVPRRESLRRMGAVLAGMVLSPLGLNTAWAGPPDPCKSFCRCSNKAQQNQCLAACRACNRDASRLVGSCGSYVCCSTASCSGVCSDLASDPNCGACGNNCGDIGETCCGNYCADLANDFDNCGACGARCADPGPYEDGACIDGVCFYTCADGAVRCGDYCADLANDFNNCGACGAACADPGPYEDGACVWGECVYLCAQGAIDCDGLCTPVMSDPNNCGACGNVCPASAPYCNQGACTSALCPGGGALCNGVCTNLNFDTLNCGACGVRCGDGETCSGGVCQSPW